MNIGSHNSYNKISGVNFTSVVPLKVFINGELQADSQMVKKAVVATSKILANPACGNQKFIGVKHEFMRYDRDFASREGKPKSGTIIRNFVQNGISYLFTGIHAEQIDKIGRMIGPAKATAKKAYGSTKNQTVSALGRMYYDKIREFISFPKARVREFIDPKTRMYAGDEMELRIYAASEGEIGNKNFKINVDKVEFKKAGEEPFDIKKTEEIKPTQTDNAKSQTQPIKEEASPPKKTIAGRKKCKISPDGYQTKIDFGK